MPCKGNVVRKELNKAKRVVKSAKRELASTYRGAKSSTERTVASGRSKGERATKLKKRR